MIELFLKGLFIGLAIAAPVGPMSILCMQRSLHEGFRVGFLTGLGVAFADGTYGLIAGLGLTALSSLLIHYKIAIKIVGGLFLIYLGLKFIVMSPSVKTQSNTRERSSWHACTTAYLLTLTSPYTIVLFIAIFAGLGIGTFHPSPLHAFSLVGGIVAGSSAWWLFFCSLMVFVIHKRLNPTAMKIINVISGLVILGFGLYTIIA